MAETCDTDNSGSKILEELLRSSKNNTESTIRKTPPAPSQSPAIYRIKPRPRGQMGPAKEARVCSCHTVHEEKLSVPKTKSKKHGKKQDHFPNLKIFSNGKMNSNGTRKLPSSTSCAPVVPDISEVNTYGVTGGEMIREISRIMELTRSGNLMEREIAHRIATLKRLTAEAESQLSGVTPSQARYGATGSATQGLAWDPETLGGGADPAWPGGRPGGGHQGQGAHGDPMLVLRPSPVVPELSDVPPLEDLLTVPTSFTEATRMVFALRQDMLTLRNVLLKWSCARATDEIEKFRTRGRAKDQVLLQQLGRIFSAPQLAYMRDGGKRGVPWTPGDYLRTIGLRSLCSYQAFQYVTQTMKIPLPSMHAVRSMANSGIFPEVTRQYEELRQAKEMAFALGKSGKQPSKKRPKDEDDGGGGTPQRRTESERGLRTRGGGRGRGRGTPSAKRRRSDSDWEPEMLQSASRRTNAQRDSHQERSNSVSDQDSEQGSDQEEVWDPDDSDQELPHDWDQEPAQSTPRRPSWSAALLQAGAERTWDDRDGEDSDEANRKVDFPVRVPAMSAPLTSGRGRGRSRGRGSRARGVRGGRGRQRAGRAGPGEVRSMGAKGAKWKQSQYNALGAVADMSEDERLQSDSDGDGRAPDRERQEGRYDGRASPGRGWTGHQAWSHKSPPRRHSPKKKRKKASKRDRAMRV